MNKHVCPNYHITNKKQENLVIFFTRFPSEDRQHTKKTTVNFLKSIC